MIENNNNLNQPDPEDLLGSGEQLIEKVEKQKGYPSLNGMES